MCVAIVKPAKFVISEEILRRCWKTNNDGCGIAYIKYAKGKGKAKNKMCVYHSLGLNAFLKELKKVEKAYPKYPMLLHFRANSRGETSLDNCHPFIIDSEHSFVHNGTISKVDDDPNKKRSDTSMFNETILQKLPAGWFHNPVIKELVEDWVGFSKLAMLRLDGEVMIFNKEKGDESDEGVWFSNTQWRAPTSYNSFSHNNYSRNTKKNTHKQTDNWQNNWGRGDDGYGEMDAGSSGCESAFKDGTYDQHTDLTKWCTRENAYHGQNRVHNNQYEKFDYYIIKWSRLADWKEKHLSDIAKEEDKTSTQKTLDLTNAGLADDAPEPVENIYELPSEDIAQMADDLGIPEKKTQFKLEVTDVCGVTDEVDFARCEMCWKPDYASYITVVQVDKEELMLCEECEHNLAEHGLLPKKDEDKK